jgi:hypothetical protein
MGLQPLGTPSAPNKTRPVPYWPVRHQVFRWRSSKTSEHINLLIYGTAHHDRANRRLQCSTWASCRDRVATAGRDVARAERADARAWPGVEVRYLLHRCRLPVPRCFQFKLANPVEHKPKRKCTCSTPYSVPRRERGCGETFLFNRSRYTKLLFRVSITPS